METLDRDQRNGNDKGTSYATYLLLEGDLGGSDILIGEASRPHHASTQREGNPMKTNNVRTAQGVLNDVGVLGMYKRSIQLLQNTKKLIYRSQDQSYIDRTTSDQ